MRISLGDVSLWFDVSGPSVIPRGDTTVERPVLVAVHGGPGLDHLTVKSALGPLAEDFQVMYFDLRGHGRSDHSSAEFWNIRTWADDLRRLCDALGLRRAQRSQPCTQPDTIAPWAATCIHTQTQGSGEGDARASGEFRAIVVKEFGDWAWGAAGDLLEGAGGVVVLAGQDRPLARDE